MIVAMTGQCFWRFPRLPGQCSWLFTPGSYPSEFTSEIMYQRVGDVLFFVSGTRQRVFRLNENDVWTCASATFYKVNQSTGNHWKNICYNHTITFDKEGLTFIYSSDLYLRKTIPDTDDREYRYRGMTHDTYTATGPLGKPVQGN
jgi:hypothetical protein